MAYRLPTERVQVTADDLSIEVESVVAWPVAHVAGALVAAFYAASPGDAELNALRDLYGYFLAEAQPSWDIEDHRGRIPTTVTGMLRFPIDVSLRLISEWLATCVPKSTAADEVLPEGPVRDEVNAALRKARRKQKG